MTESIEGSGYPLGFILREGPRPSLLGAGRGRSVYVTEARMLAGHQKEAVVHEGEGGQVWRLTSDEGRHLNGADVSPFPLGFFNAGLQGDILGRALAMAEARGIDIGSPEMFLQNFYWMTGSFVKGTGVGFSDPPKAQVTGDAAALADLVAEAVKASPAVDGLARGLTNTFALYVNGTRETVTTMTPSTAPDAPDPYRTYSTPPAPLAGTPPDPIVKTGELEQGEVKPAPTGTDTRIIRTVSGRSRVVDGRVVETDTWLEMPGVSHFKLSTDERAEGNQAPSGLACYAAGIAFCYMTQLSRYMHNMKLDTGGLRLVQYTPFEVTEDGRGICGPADTHLFLNGRADAETHEMLIRVAATTCYLHATLKAEIPPEISVGAFAA